MNYYEELGLSKDASEKEIKQAFRKLAKENHPDKTNGDKVKEEKFKNVNEAYQTLSDSTLKAQYDSMLNYGFGKGGNKGFNNFNFHEYAQKNSNNGNSKFTDEEFDEIIKNSSFFSDLFKSKVKQATTLNLNLSFREAAFGCTKTVIIPENILPGEIKTNIKIPPATEHGSELIITVKGVSFHIVCKVSPDSQYQRDGLNLILELDVPLITALIGGSVIFNHFGKPLEVNIPEGANTGNKLRLKGLGLTKNGETGHIFLTLKVVNPKNLTKRQKELLKEFNQIELTK